LNARLLAIYMMLSFSIPRARTTPGMIRLKPSIPKIWKDYSVKPMLTGGSTPPSLFMPLANEKVQLVSLGGA
jgi:hypothetical protein